jgi:hypothetical protein
MPASLIIGALGLEAGGLAAGLVTLGIRLAETYAISSLINKNQDQSTTQSSTTQGGAVQLPPATNNKLPVVYGVHYVSPIIVDALLSTDQQTMWYVLAFSETTDSGDITFGDIYWDDKLLIFNDTNPSEITSWYVPATAGGAEANTRVTGVAGKIGMWFYNNGSANETTHRCFANNGDGTIISQQKSNIDAISVLNDGAIPPEIRWTANNLMSNTVFAICRVNYDKNHGVTQLGQIKAEIQNTLGTGMDANDNQIANMGPGSVIKDYLLNPRYGCGLEIANINTDSLTALDVFSNLQHELKLTTGAMVGGPHYQINGILNTAQDCMVNLNILADCVDSWIQWDERYAKWGVIMNIAYDDIDPNAQISSLFSINKDNIIGGINVLPTDLKTSNNKLTIQYPNFTLQNQTDYRYYDLPMNLRNANEPENTLTVNFPFVDNDLQATWLGYKKLWTTREDLVVNFTMDYSGIKIDAGDVIRITHDWYGFVDKLFRVTQVKEAKDPSGFLSVQISAISYNEGIYYETDPGFFSVTEFNRNGLTDPNYITPCGKPTIGGVNTATILNTFVVTTTVPGAGNVDGIEFWYGKTPTVSVNDFTLYETQHYVNANPSGVNTRLYPHDGTESCNVIAMPKGVYYWATRAVGPFAASAFSEVSDVWQWDPVIPPNSVIGVSVVDNTVSGTKVISGDPATTGQPASKGFFDTLGPIAFGGLGLAAAYYGYKYFTDGARVPAPIYDYSENYTYESSGQDNSGGGEGAGSQPTMTTLDTIYTDNNGNPVDDPQPGDIQEIQVAASPIYDEPQAYTNFDDYPDAGGDYYG